MESSSPIVILSKPERMRGRAEGSRECLSLKCRCRRFYDLPRFSEQEILVKVAEAVVESANGLGILRLRAHQGTNPTDFSSAALRMTILKRIAMNRVCNESILRELAARSF